MDYRVRRAIALVEAHLDEGWSSAELAELVNLSPSRLNQLFKEETGMPPARYLRRLRMERAKHLLEITDLSVKQVMAAVGVFDESHFVRDFKMSFGLTPARHRARFLSSYPDEQACDGCGRMVAATDPAPLPSAVGPAAAPPLLVRRASHPRQFSARGRVRPPLREDADRRELLSLLSERHAVFAEVTTAITGNIVREKPSGRSISYKPRHVAVSRRLPPAAEHYPAPRRRS